MHFLYNTIEIGSHLLMLKKVFKNFLLFNINCLYNKYYNNPVYSFWIKNTAVWTHYYSIMIGRNDESAFLARHSQMKPPLLGITIQVMRNRCSTSYNNVYNIVYDRNRIALLRKIVYELLLFNINCLYNNMVNIIILLCLHSESKTRLFGPIIIDRND